MRTVYAIQFRLSPQPGQSRQSVIEDVQSRVAQWIVGKYERVWQTHVTLAFDGAVTEPLHGHTLRCWLQAVSDINLLTVDWSHPHDRDPSSMWRTSVVAGCQGQDVEVAITIRIATVQMVMRPVGYELGRPRLVSQLIDDYAPCMNGWPVPSSVETVKTADVTRFANEVLLAPERSLPVVLVTPDTWTESPRVDPDETFDAVMGFAHVAVMESKWAAFKLTDVLEKDLSCYNGAVRIYWPGFTLDANPFNHRLYLPGNLEYWRAKRIPFGKHLFRMLTAISAFRFTEGPAIRDARKAIAEAERADLARIAEEATHGRANKEQLESQLLDVMIKLEDLSKENDALKADLAAQKAAWGDIQGFMAQAEPDEDASEPVAPPPLKEASFATVADAYQMAKKEFAGPLLFLDSADRSAAESPFKSPERVYELFEALHLVAREWRERKGALGQSWNDAMRDLGFDYRDQVSATTKGKWRKDYEFPYKGQSRLFERHITLGAKQADKCLSVHFYRDDEDLVLVVGHCGRHLTNTKT